MTLIAGFVIATRNWNRQKAELQSWTLSFKDFMKIIVMARVLMNVLQECQQPKILNRNS